MISDYEDISDGRVSKVAASPRTSADNAALADRLAKLRLVLPAFAEEAMGARREASRLRSQNPRSNRTAKPRVHQAESGVVVILFALGISHRTAPVEQRERVSLSSRRASNLPQDLARDTRVVEVVALSTCNRTELLRHSALN
jgi:Glutamyl-tRNAGlu reductase, N-terminal domain